MGDIVRPRFELASSLTAREIHRRLEGHLRATGCPMCGLVAEGRIELAVPSARQHLWSPQLTVDVVEAEPGGATLCARYGPHPAVWSMYVAAYAALAFASLVAASFAYAQWVMNESPWALWGLPTVAALGIGMQLVARAGQHLGAEQMDELRVFLESALDREPAPSTRRRLRPAHA